MSQIKLSDIKAARHGYEIGYLLDLVKRLGEMTAKLACRYHERAGHDGIWEDCTYPKCRAAHTLLKELEL
ncbi:hypothetical protein LCGC14_1510170 [marine sediment metagenome]|uniref:Uncharacterized protein n=1 Tax=marine sediment metagenome TaxID=412755 RepID=A0A0F9M2T8_9ZZZZ